MANRQHRPGVRVVLCLADGTPIRPGVPVLPPRSIRPWLAGRLAEECLRQARERSIVQGGPGPEQAHNLHQAGSTPAPATIAQTIRGTVMARDGEGDCRPTTRRDRDSRERPAPFSLPAATAPTPDDPTPIAAGGTHTTNAGTGVRTA